MFCRGRPVCRPVAGPAQRRARADTSVRPYAGRERSGATGIGVKRSLSPTGRDGARPLRGGGAGRCVQERRGVVTPPYGSATGGAKQRADVPRAWLPPTKFRAEIWGVSHGHRPLRPAGDEGRHAGSSCPTGGCGEPPRLPWVAAHSRASAPAVARKWAGSGAEITLKVSIYAGQSLSQPAADSSLCTREP